MTRRDLPPGDVRGGRSAALEQVRRVSPGDELLDGPLHDPLVLEGNLRDLRRANRWLGGARLSLRAVDALLAGAEQAHVLDVGTGAADIPLLMLARAREQGRSWQVTAVDSRPEVISAARTLSPQVTSTPGLSLEVADGTALPYPDRAFDVSHVSLVLHHLEPAGAVVLLRELARVATSGVVVNDLVRSPLTLVGAWLLAKLTTTNRYTRHDAPLSARRAYSRDELVALLGAAGLRVVADLGGLARHRRAMAAVPT